MAKRGFTSTINTIAREQARKQRQAEAEQKRLERERIQQERAAERARTQLTKENKQRYIEARAKEAEDETAMLSDRIQELRAILEHTLAVDDTISFDSLRIREKYSSVYIPANLTKAEEPPKEETFLSGVKPLGFFENALGLKNRYQRELEEAKNRFKAAFDAYEKAEQDRQRKLADLQAQDEAGKQAFKLKVEQRNQEVAELEAAYMSGDVTAVITYNTMVLEQSDYPEGFPQAFRLAYIPESKEIVIEYELPDASVIPSVAEYRYIRTRDVIEEKPRKLTEIKELYQDIVASVTLRTIHEVLEADQADLIEVVVFNGVVQTIDPSTGKDVRPCIVSVRTTREKFMEINLARIDKRACLRNLGAQVSAQPQALQPVKPVVEFSMVDKRFIEDGDVLAELESRPNLMDLTPSEFEALVSNLFGKMGLDTKLTRASRDGGVDAVAFDTRPILGGKVVIQAKRYKNTVGVSAVRDLYGTMLNEGASKGILVATSSYGPDAYNFANDKPLELIDGGGLLYLLDQVGIQARIVFPEDS